MHGMVIGILKSRIEKYRDIVQTILKKEKLSENQKEFLRKEKFEI